MKYEYRFFIRSVPYVNDGEFVICDMKEAISDFDDEMDRLGTVIDAEDWETEFETWLVEAYLIDLEQPLAQVLVEIQPNITNVLALNKFMKCFLELTHKIYGDDKNG